MELDERIITRAIIDRYSKKLIEYTDVDTAIVGGGPAGLVAAYFLAQAGRKVAVFERKLSIGGPRMGPIFGGMLLSGKKAAELVINR